MARGREGSSKLLWVVLLGLLGAGAYNYHRNYQAEAAVPRPYSSYAVADLEALLEAYQGENRSLEQSYAAARRAGSRDARGGLIGENVKAFEQAQRRASTHRGLGAKLSMQQAAQKEIERELALRRAHADLMKLHLKRLLTI
jgi:hypothetical protein